MCVYKFSLPTFIRIFSRIINFYLDHGLSNILVITMFFLDVELIQYDQNVGSVSVKTKYLYNTIASQTKIKTLSKGKYHWRVIIKRTFSYILLHHIMSDSAKFIFYISVP